MGTTTLAFHGQDYPADRRELIILDDAGELQNDSCDGWQIISIPRQFRSLPEKFNAIAGRRKATSSSSGRTTTSTCHTTSARTCQRWKGGSGQSHRLCSAVTPDVWSRKTPPVASTPHRTVVIPAAAFSLRLGVRMCLSRKDAMVIRHRTTRTLPLAYGLKIRPSRQLARAIRTASPANAQFFQEPKTLTKQDHDSSKLSNDRWMAPSFCPPRCFSSLCCALQPQTGRHDVAMVREPMAYARKQTKP